MRVLGIGLDILRMHRIADLYVKHPIRFPRRILSVDEQKAFVYLTSKHIDDASTLSCTSPSVQFLSKRFAIKEAAYKALFPRFELTWKMLSLKEANQKPSLKLEESSYPILRERLDKQRKLNATLFPRSTLYLPDPLKKGQDKVLADAVKNELGFLFMEAEDSKASFLEISPESLHFEISLSHDGDILAGVVLARYTAAESQNISRI